MSYARTMEGAKKRVMIKRELRKLGIKGWKKDDSMKKLKSLLKKEIKLY